MAKGEEKQKTRVVFMGTPEFAVDSLKALLDGGFDVVAVVTQPDRPKGRGRKLKPSPVKVAAEELGLEVLTPGKIKEAAVVEKLSGYGADFFIVVAYGKILPKVVLDIPKQGCVNVHASILPKYRGAAPINRALMAGEKTTGVTTMMLDEGMDTGDILLTHEIKTRDYDAGRVTEVLANFGAKLLVKTIGGLVEGTVEPVEQNEADATYAPMLKKADGLIDWSRPAEEIYNLVRGLNPSPAAYTHLGATRFKINSGSVASKARVVEEAPVEDMNGAEPGTIIHTGTKPDYGIYVKCGEGAYRILTFTPEGKRSMWTGDYLLGHEIKGERFGE